MAFKLEMDLITDVYTTNGIHKTKEKRAALLGVP